MSARILIGIDNSSFSQKAISFGLRLAQRCNATLVGMCVIDKQVIERHSANAGPGSFFYAEKHIEKQIGEAKVRLENLLTNFEGQCKVAGIKYERILVEGNPAKEIIRETELADLLIIGIRTFFHFETSDESDETFEKVISHGKCPIFAVTDEELPVEMDVLVAYDGQPKANNAIKAFAAVNDRVHFSHSVTVLNVNDVMEEGNLIVKKAETYLRAHDLNITSKIVEGKPREVIFQTAKGCEEHKKTLLVMGTNGNNELSDYILGNSIKIIISQNTIPLFIYH